MTTEFKLPAGFEYLRGYVDKLLQVSPIDKNVFVMMRFDDTPQLRQIRAVLIDSLKNIGLNPLLADEKTYHPRLWDNVCVHMLASSYGVAVFEQIDSVDFNPNVAIELGFMIALGRRCIPLKDRRLKAMPVDISSLLYKEFDSYDIARSIRKAVSDWATSEIDFHLSFAQHLFGYYKSEWSSYDNITTIGKATIIGSGMEINVILRDEKASSYTAKIEIVGYRKLIATWVNVDDPEDFGRWEATVSEDMNTIEGKYMCTDDPATGLWKLTRLP